MGEWLTDLGAVDDEDLTARGKERRRCGDFARSSIDLGSVVMGVRVGEWEMVWGVEMGMESGA